MTRNFAGSLTTAACAGGLTSIDYVVLSDDGGRAYAVHGNVNSPFKRVADVDVAQSVAKPLEQSSTEFVQAAHHQEAQQQAAQQQTQANAQESSQALELPALQR